MELEDGSCYSIGCPYSFVDSVRAAEQEGCVRIFTDGKIFSGDKIFHNFPGSYTVDLKSGEAVAQEFIGVNPSGLYGLERSGDKYRFGDCLVEGVADLVLEFDDHLEILDYKTDRGKTHEQFVAAYRPQLLMYAEAIGGGFKKPATRLSLYSFALGAEITVDPA